MRKRIVSIIAAVLLLLFCFGCGKSQSGLEMAGDAYVPPNGTLFENDKCKATVKSVTWSEERQAEMILAIENLTEKRITVSAELLSINQTMMPSPAPLAIENGESKELTITIPNSELSRAGITSIHDVDFLLDAHTSETDERLAYEHVSFSIGKDKNKKEQAAVSKDVLFENDNCRITLEGLYPDTDLTEAMPFSNQEPSGELGTGILLHCTNKTDRDVSFSILSGEHQGRPISVSWMQGLTDGCSTYAMVVVPYSSIGKESILPGTEITMNLQVNVLATYEELANVQLHVLVDE